MKIVHFNMTVIKC